MNKKHTLSELIQYFKLQTTADIDEQAISDELQQGQTEQTSVAIKIISVFGGFFATLAFLGFLLLVGLYNSEEGLLFFGFIFIAGALAINKMFQKTITDTASICAYMTGHAMIAFSLVELDADLNVICILFIGISALTLYISQTYVLSFIATLTALMSLLAMVFIAEAFNAIHLFIILLTVVLTTVLLNEAKIIIELKGHSKLYGPVSMALIVALIISFGIVNVSNIDFLPIQYVWTSSIVTISAVVFIVSKILKIFKTESLTKIIGAYVSIGFVLLPTIYAPAISGALLILLLCFLVNQKTGLAVGIISFIYFISQFYYDLHFTLLLKSIILFLTGISCLLIYIFIIKKIESNENI